MRYPIHFDITGTPNRWANKTVPGVYGLLVFAAQFALFFWVMMWAAWYGTRRSDSMRRPMMLIMLAGEATVSLIVGLIPLHTAAGFHISVLGMLSPVLLLFAAIAYAVHESNQPRDPDPTPNECWTAGMFYYNPKDAALFVQRRDIQIPMVNPSFSQPETECRPPREGEVANSLTAQNDPLSC